MTRQRIPTEHFANAMRPKRTANDHGTWQRYEQECRCARCREAYRVYRRAKRDADVNNQEQVKKVRSALQARGLVLYKQHPLKHGDALANVERAARPWLVFASERDRLMNAQPLIRFATIAEVARHYQVTT